jgi:anti-anti-sigma regulatory factor
MLRITQISEDQNTLRLRLDGAIAGEALDELRAACSTIRNGGDRTLIFDMAGVDFMSNQAAQELIELSTGNCRVINCSPFISTLLETVNLEKQQ